MFEYYKGELKNYGQAILKLNNRIVNKELFKDSIKV